uniref:Deoxyuridine 5'-triphosphate nucleotidohydrolase n=1 Tax=Scophthalmus maximus TaxID=52904 RepID=A0A8D3DAL8_SCOMX
MPVLEDTTDAPAVSPSKRTRTDTRPADQRAVLRFAKLSEHARTPTRGSTKAAGYDLYSAYDYSIGPMDKAIVKTDIQIAVPHGCYGRVAPRSGLAAKHFIDVGAGVVDEDYRGNVGVVLFNFSKDTFDVKKGDRVAQLVCERICYPDLEEQEVRNEDTFLLSQNVGGRRQKSSECVFTAASFVTSESLLYVMLSHRLWMRRSVGPEDSDQLGVTKSTNLTCTCIC